VLNLRDPIGEAALKDVLFWKWNKSNYRWVFLFCTQENTPPELVVNELRHISVQQTQNSLRWPGGSRLINSDPSRTANPGTPPASQICNCLQLSDNSPSDNSPYRGSYSLIGPWSSPHPKIATVRSNLTEIPSKALLPSPDFA
jgi:hypothetical protein